MIPRLRPYPAYRETEEEWLGEIPNHWNVIRGKWLLNCIDVRSTSGDEELLTVSSERGVIPRSDATVTMFKAESYKGYKLCWPGDLVINSLWAWARGLGVSQHHGIVSSAYGVYRLKKQYREYAGYIHRLVRSSPFNYEMQVRSKGIWVSRLQLTDAAFLGAPIPFPTRREQSAIVRFLSHANRSIQRYIHAKQKLLSLLEEQKQAVIHQAVTGKIDVHTGKPYLAYKPSGVEWLGDVPEHWEVCKLGQIGRFSKGKGGNKEDEVSAGIPCVRYGDLYTSHRYFIQQSRSYVSEQKAVDYTSIHFGDVLFAGSGETIDEIGTSAVNLILSDTVCGGDVIILRPNRQFNAEFMGYLMDCRPVATQKSAMGRGITVMHIYSSHLKNVTVAFPPLSEQKAIVPYLGNTNNALDSAISNVQQEIELLAEYCTRLVSDVVTGKLDVREAASNLPNEAESMDAMDDSPEIKSINESVSQVAG